MSTSTLSTGKLPSAKLPGPPYKAANGHYYTSQMFLERWNLLMPIDQVCLPIFSFLGVPGYISVRASFIELRDPTGYKWADKYLKDYKHFEKLMEAPWFSSVFKALQKELKEILKSEAIQKIIQIASEDSPQALQAAKYIASAEWEKATSGRGRPSKEELRGELKRAADQVYQESEDAERIGLIGKVN